MAPAPRAARRLGKDKSLRGRRRAPCNVARPALAVLDRLGLDRCLFGISLTSTDAFSASPWPRHVRQPTRTGTSRPGQHTCRSALAFSSRNSGYEGQGAAPRAHMFRRALQRLPRSRALPTMRSVSPAARRVVCSRVSSRRAGDDGLLQRRARRPREAAALAGAARSAPGHGRMTQRHPADGEPPRCRPPRTRTAGPARRRKSMPPIRARLPTCAAICPPRRRQHARRLHQGSFHLGCETRGPLPIGKQPSCLGCCSAHLESPWARAPLGACLPQHEHASIRGRPLGP